MAPMIGAGVLDALGDVLKRRIGAPPPGVAPIPQPAAAQPPRIGMVAPAAPATPPRIGAPTPTAPVNNLPGLIGAPQPDLARDVAAGHVPQPTPPGADVGKPTMGRRLIGAGLGALVGLGSNNAAEGAKVGGGYVTRPRDQAEELYNQENKQWEGAQKTGAEEQNAARQQALTDEEIRNMQSEERTRENPPDKTKPGPTAGSTVESGGQAYQWNEATQKYDIPVGNAKPANTQAEITHTYVDDKGNEVGIRRDGTTQIMGKAKPEKPAAEPGTWQLVDGAGGTVLEYNSKTGETRPAPAGVRPKDDRIAQQETQRADLAQNVNENLDRLEEIVTRRPDLFGKVGGRMTQLKEFIGTNDPDVAALKELSDNFGKASQGAHGMRNGRTLEGTIDALLNGYKNGDKAILQAIKDARGSVKTFIEDVQEKGGTTTGSPARSTSAAPAQPAGKWNPITGRYE